MDSSEINETTILQAARAVELAIAPEHLPGVLHYYRMVADFAATVGAFPLTENDEPAAVFIPCQAKTRE